MDGREEREIQCQVTHQSNTEHQRRDHIIKLTLLFSVNLINSRETDLTVVVVSGNKV